MNIHTAMVEIDQWEHCHAIGILGMFVKMQIVNNVRLTYRHICCCYTYARRLESEENQTNIPKIPIAWQCSHWSISTIAVWIFISIKPTIQYFPATSDTWLSRDGFEHCHQIQVSKLLRFFLDGLAHLWRNSNYAIYSFVWNVGCVHCELITSVM
jgi:hypothetical protein